MTRIIGALLLVLVLCAAKATVGQPFNDANLPALQPGVTTLEQANALLGRASDGMQVGESGAIGHTWTFAQGKSSFWTGKVSGQAKVAVLVFNPDGTFQRILRLHGITLAPDDMRRLVSDPAAATAASR